METLNKANEKSWKAKAIARGKDNRGLRSEKKRQHERAEKWRIRYYELKKHGELTRVKEHPYPLELMWLGVIMRISYNISLRGVSQSLCKIGDLYGLAIDYISPSTVRNWCLKFGLYCLFQPIKSGKYVLILDESVEIGKEHLMVLLVVPIKNSSPIQALSLDDIRVLDVKVQSSWKGKEIADLIKKHQAAGVEISYGISDGGHTLKNALSRCGITWVSDCTHEMANRAKALFKNDESFNGFIKRLNALRAKWIMSKNNFYVPPGLRAKSRFHQLFIVHKWARFILNSWDKIPEITKIELDFVKQEEALVVVMEQFHFLIDTFATIFKNRGIQKISIQQWQTQITAFLEDLEQYKSHVDQRVKSFIDAMNTYLEKQQAKFDNPNHDNQILCCSDIIESSFGKYKNKGGAKIMTEDVLNIAAYPEQKDKEQIKLAMQSIKIVQIQDWKKQNTTVSKLAQLKKFKAKSAA